MKKNINFHNRDFLKLRDKWYQILKERGFKDIEKWKEVRDNPHNDIPPLEEELARNYGAKKPEKFNSKQAYYQEVGRYLYSGEIKNRLELDLWEMHSSGLTLKQMLTSRDKRNCKPLKKSSISNKLRKTRQKMIEHLVQEYEEQDALDKELKEFTDDELFNIINFRN